MLDWVNEEPRLQTKKSTLLISPQMAEVVFEISKPNCYLLLAPYEVPCGGKVDLNLLKQSDHVAFFTPLPKQLLN
jgi:hypothetical protein